MAGTRQSENNVNLSLYDKLRTVPEEAKKKIESGRLAGKTDINPMYRIKRMTEVFGPCGIGWKYEIVKQWQEQYGQEVKAFTNINLYFKHNDIWSEPIPGNGGATLVEVNSKGYVYVNDEGFKMSLTDALSVAMKALGVAADVYYEKDMINFESKYETNDVASSQPTPAGQPTTTNKTKQGSGASQAPQTSAPQAPAAQAPAETPASPQPQTPLSTLTDVKKDIEDCKSVNELMEVWNKHPELQGVKDFRDALAAKRAQIQPPSK